ncbi:3-isopropylmalate dehydratase small subunit [Paracoccus sp. (in: a-proteobacteria)]|uniref:3-isopropylmalate dehydratase small subunit n=1 Tax=Paracoccus sp. TaxID=267 RepID=UPI003A8C55F6
MNPMTVIRGPLALIERDNVDTDAIIPAIHTQEITTRLASGLFGNWRYRPDGSENPDFVLNRAPWNKAVALVSCANFGCGSSREQAPWALKDFGIRAIFAASFGDIFAANCLKNGILAWVLPDGALAMLREVAEDPARCEILIDIPADLVSAGDRRITLNLPDTIRNKLVSGKDDIEIVLDRSDAISEFQAQDRARRPWVWNA